MSLKKFDLSNQCYMEEIRNVLLADDYDPVAIEDLEEECNIDLQDEMEQRRKGLRYGAGLCLWVRR